jgi:hypothetical protein
VGNTRPFIGCGSVQVVSNVIVDCWCEEERRRRPQGAL